MSFKPALGGMVSRTEVISTGIRARMKIGGLKEKNKQVGARKKC